MKTKEHDNVRYGDGYGRCTENGEITNPCWKDSQVGWDQNDLKLHHKSMRSYNELQKEE